MAILHRLCLWRLQIHDMFIPAPSSNVCVVQGDWCYLPWVQFLSYTMLPSLSSFWHLGNLRLTKNVTLDPTRAGLSLSSLAVTLPPVEKKMGLHCSKGCISLQLFPLEMLDSKGLFAAYSLALLPKPQLRTIRGTRHIHPHFLLVCHSFPSPNWECGFLPVDIIVFQRRIFLFLPGDTAFRPQLRPGDNEQDLHQSCQTEAHSVLLMCSSWSYPSSRPCFKPWIVLEPWSLIFPSQY